jgi:phage tail sheath protein FI
MLTYRAPGIYFEQRDASPPVLGPVRTDVAGFVGIALRGPLHWPVRVESMTQFRHVFGGEIAQGYLAYAVREYFADGGTACWIVRSADPKNARKAALDIVDAAGAYVLNICAGSEGTWGNEIVARWILRGDRIVSLTLHYPDGTEELFRNPQSPPPDGISQLELDTEKLPADLIAPLADTSTDATRPKAPMCVSISEGVGQLSGGTDGLTTLEARHLTGEDAPLNARWGLAALEVVDEVAMVAIPDLMPKLRVAAETTPPPKPDCSLLDPPPQPEPLPTKPPEFPPALGIDEARDAQEALIRHCEKLRYRVAILDSYDDSVGRPVPEGAIATATLFRNTNFAALYYPWILVDDPLRLTGLVRAIPPSGAVAGVYARTDHLYGVHKPPANEVVQGALDVRFPIDDIIHGELNEAGVNAIRSYSGRGIRVYGARTTTSDSEWRYVNVRRLLCMIEKSIDRNSQWIVWEPNSAALRREIDRTVRSFLEDLFRRGMLDGADSSEAYRVKCDDATTPPEEVDMGRVICRIEVQPPYPAEIVVVVIGVTQHATEILSEGGAIDA